MMATVCIYIYGICSRIYNSYIYMSSLLSLLHAVGVLLFTPHSTTAFAFFVVQKPRRAKNECEKKIPSKYQKVPAIDNYFAFASRKTLAIAADGIVAPLARRLWPSEPPSLFKIFLMILLSGVKCRVRRDLHCTARDGTAVGFCDLLLLFVVPENGGAVLAANVPALAVFLERIDFFEKGGAQLVVGDFRGVIEELYGFGVAGGPRADGIVGGIGDAASSVADSGGCDAGEPLEHEFDGPEATAGEGADLGSSRDVRRGPRSLQGRGSTSKEAIQQRSKRWAVWLLDR
jgi:hypothetical protein